MIFLALGLFHARVLHALLAGAALAIFVALDALVVAAHARATLLLDRGQQAIVIECRRRRIMAAGMEGQDSHEANQRGWDRRRVRGVSFGTYQPLF